MIKKLVIITLICCMSIISMEIEQEVGEEMFNVPSLKLLAFNVVKQNLHRIGWRTDRNTSQIYDVICSEISGLSIFERARLIDMFKITDQYEKVAKEIASFIDTHETPMERKIALHELLNLSIDMQRRISKYRMN